MFGEQDSQRRAGSLNGKMKNDTWVKSATADFCPENMQMLIALDWSLTFCLQPVGYTDHNRS